MHPSLAREARSIRGGFDRCGFISERAHWELTPRPIEIDMPLTDKELLRAFAKARSLDAFTPLLERYLSVVYSAAYRQLPLETEASEITQAVFLAFAHRGRHLSRRRPLVDWFFRATWFAAAKVRRRMKGRGKAVGPAVSPINAPAADETSARLAPVIDRSVMRLPTKLRRAVLVGALAGWDLQQTAASLRTSSRRAERRCRKGLQKLRLRLAKRKVPLELPALREWLSTRFCGEPVPADLRSAIIAAAPDCFRRLPKERLARRVLGALTWAKWKVRLRFAAMVVVAVLLLVGGLLGTTTILWRTGRLLPWIVRLTSTIEARQHPEVVQPAKPWPPDRTQYLAGTLVPRSASDLYRTTNIWLAHLRFSAEQWVALQPKSVPPVREILKPDGTVVLRNPYAQRSGVAGALGFDFNWAPATFELNDQTFPNVAARLRGNGTFLTSMHGWKRPFKIDLNKFEKGQDLAGVRTLNFGNLIGDRSYLHDALGYELFRDASVPAPRSAYAWLTISAPEFGERKPLGLYLLVENLDSDFASEHFGSKKAPILKPVTPDLFKDLGSNWKDYADIYDVKTKLSPAQQQRVMDFAKLLTHADDDEFARRAGDFIDLEEFARYLSVLVLIANYDSFLTYGQNFYMYLDPQTGKMGFMPWDLDQGWGSFPQFGTSMTRERASIWHPWVGRNRLLERLLKVEGFRHLYRQEMERQLATLFVPERLWRRIDEIAANLRAAIAAESEFRSQLFEKAVSTNWLAGPRDGGEDLRRPVHQVKRFIVNRAASVRAQLDGQTDGLRLHRVEWGE